MLTLFFRRTAVVVTAAVALFAAAGSMGRASARPASALPPLSVGWRHAYMAQHGFANHAGARGLLAPLSSGKYLYVAEYDLGVIFVYDATVKTNPLPLGYIADGVSYPSAIAFDRKQNLYVANEGTSTVTVYAPGSTTVAKTIPTIFPLALAFGTDGTLYVTGNDPKAGNEVEIFAPGGSKPTTIPAPLGAEPDGAAVDANNVLTLSVNNASQDGYLFTYPNGLSHPVQVFGNIGMLEGLAYDAGGRLYAGAFNANAVYVFTPPSWSYQTVSNGIARPIGLTVDPTDFYVANSSVPSVEAFASIGGSPTVFTRDLTFVTSVGVSDTLAANVEQNIYRTQECNCSEVDIYSANPKAPKEKAVITQGLRTPDGIWLDDSGNLWVADYGSPIVTELAAGSHKAVRFLTTALNRPVAVAVDHTGTIYVSDIGNQNVAVFAPGATAPERTLNGCTAHPQFMTVDAANNLYLACGSDVIVYAPGSSTGKNLGLTNINYALGVALDAHGNLYVADYLGSAIDVYAPKTTKPARMITTGVNVPAQIAIGASGRLYVANLSGGVDSIYAPGGSTPIGSIPGNSQGITTGP